jgi:hypothetical protein
MLTMILCKENKIQRWEKKKIEGILSLATSEGGEVLENCADYEDVWSEERKQIAGMIAVESTSEVCVHGDEVKVWRCRCVGLAWRIF